MKKIFFTVIIASIVVTSFSQRERRDIDIPNLPGYYTLKCDLHSHTVFSDGRVWPTERINEAWNDGLDAIAITDHIEYTPNKNDIMINRNRPHEIASGQANQMSMILIKGAELTRSYPCGHHNLLFIEDAEALNKKDSMQSFAEAKKQNAVFMWNHPGWLKPNQIPEWSNVQQTLFDKGMMNMIEIVNGSDYYPLAHQWAIDKNLAIAANSDIHSSIYQEYGNKIHRPMTLVFAKEKNAASIKEAILEGRTAIYHHDTLMGNEKFLKPLFEKSLEIVTPEITIIKKQWIEVVLKNNSDVPIMISFKGGSDEYAQLGSGVFVPAHGSARFIVKGLKEDYVGERTYNIPCVIDNYYVGVRQGLSENIQFKVKFKNK